VREIVMVIADLYWPRGADAGAGERQAAFARLPGIETAARFGARATLPRGWRAWLAEHLGRADLRGVAPACVAAAAREPASGTAGAAGAADNTTTWIASPVHLQAGLTRVHLGPGGLLRLAAPEQAALAADFGRTFGSSGPTLLPLVSGDFLLETPDLAAVATTEPARCAAGDVAEALPAGAAAAPLRRLIAEIEMWLHGQPLNEARERRGEPAVNALWLWGAEGRRVRLEVRAAREVELAFGSDPWLHGLWHLQGSRCRSVPERLDDVLAAADARRAVLVAEAGQEMRRADAGSVADGLVRLDERFVSPALEAVRRGELLSMTLVVNDSRATVRRSSRLRLWRRRRAGIGGFA
jgi:hypothetical protein